MTIISLILTLFACSTPLEQPSVEPPTVVVVIACTMRADRLHTYGNPLNTSPYIDSLARTGVRFNRTLTNAPWTRPGVAALVTGRYPLAIGIDSPEASVNTNRGLHPSITTLAEHFKAAGWATHGAVANPNANAVYNFDQGFDSYHEASGLWRDKFHKAEGADLVDAWLESVKGVDGPLYGQLIVIDTHAPLASLPVRRAKLGLPVGQGTQIERYDAAVTVLDDVIRQLDEGLAKLGRENRTLVFIGDHSEGLKYPEYAGAAHGRWLYEANLHIPWIVHGPDIAVGHAINGLSSSVDLMPTVLDLAGLPRDGDMDGLSHAQAIRGDNHTTQKTAVFSETRFANEHKARLTTDDWAYIHNYQRGQKSFARGRQELYTSTDTQQASNVSKSNPDTVSKMATQLDALRQRVEATAIFWEAPSQDNDDEALKAQLEALGYIDGE